ncbi:MAG: M15 family metallopeptidase [Alphaproteobacteria bacterium]|nr:M15 family metallopeptidase [Alphaproteobacteria bacterium]
MALIRFLTAITALGVLAPVALAGSYGAPPPDIRDRLDALVAAYPEHLISHNGTHITWRDGSKMPVSDGRTDKTFDELLNAPDIDDMFAFAYPAGTKPSAPGVNFDPGRIRSEPFFTKMYGDCRKNAAALRRAKVPWLKKHTGGSVQITTINDVHEALAGVSADLDKLPNRFVRFLKPNSGTYNCRTIAGTKRLSVHAFAAAIDINVKHAHYWKWTKPGSNGTYPWRNKIPQAIVDVFERHGFIWGGRWYHYDSMHFEYRPELFQK